MPKLAIASISVIPNNGLEGVSINKIFVFAFNNNLKSAALSDSVNEYSIPYFSNSETIKLKVPP